MSINLDSPEYSSTLKKLIKAAVQFFEDNEHVRSFYLEGYVFQLVDQGDDYLMVYTDCSK